MVVYPRTVALSSSLKTRREANLSKMAIRAVMATARGSFIRSQHDNSFLSPHPPCSPHNQGFGRSRPSTSTGVFIHLPHRRLELLLTPPRAADSTQPSSVSSSAGKTIVPDDQFSLAKVCIWLLPIGLTEQKFFIGLGFPFLFLGIF